MTFGYATLSEAWGDDLSSKKKKKKMPAQDPICDLYEMKGSSSAYTEADLVNYAYDKNKSQRTYNDTQQTKKLTLEDETFDINQSLPKSLFEKQFEVRHPQEFEMEDPQDYMVRSCPATKRQPVAQEYEAPPQPPTPPQHPKRRDYFEDEEPPRRVRQERVYDESDLESESEYDYVRPSQRKKKNKYLYLDLILYVLSGIILIFLMEQFIRIGINMQQI